ncbi:MAG: VOC family protein [Gemmatimonadota bacterium]
MRLLFVIALLLKPGVAGAQVPAVPADPAFETRGAFLGISVADLDASTRWYAEKFGMRVVFAPPPQGGFTGRVLQGGGLTLELLHNASAAPLRSVAPSVKHTTMVHGIFKGGVFVDNYDQTLSTLRARGVDVAMGPFPSRDGMPANFIVRDNGGNLIQFFSR